MNIEALSRKLQQIVTEHPAMGVLATFGAGLKRAPLDRATLEWFLACHVASVRSVPTYILTLAMRISNELMPHDYFNAHAVAARTLFAAAHEYGLANTEHGITQTHFQLYRDGLQSWGFDPSAILHHPRIFPVCAEINAYIDDVAMHRPLAQTLACHFALEEVADREFVLLYEGFSQHWQAYGLSGPDDVALRFAAGLTACLDVPDDTTETSDTEQDLLSVGTTKPPTCAAVCTETASCSTTCIDSYGTQMDCYNAGSCDPIERKAREGRNPQTGETIQIPAKTTIKR